MTQPSVTLTEIDGGLGVLPASAGKLLAVVGPSTSGPVNAPATYARVNSLVSAFEGGPLVEAAATAIDRYRKPVIVVRTEASTVGELGTVDTSLVTGTSVVTVTGTPLDDVELFLKVGTGGTVGTDGIQFVWSLDGGRNLSKTTGLGTATNFAIPGSGLTVEFAAGTLVAGDTVTARGTAPTWSGTELTAALEVLAASKVLWEIAEIVGPLDGTGFDTVEAAFASMRASGKRRAWVGNVRMPDEDETEAEYLTAMSTAFSSKATTQGELCFGACKIISSVNGRSYRRPIAFAVAAREASVSEEINIADVNLGPLAGVSIRDPNGNPDEHDESLNPGADDARFTVLRTWEGEQGVYVNRPRILAPEGSDFQLMPLRRVLNLVEDALEVYFRRRLNRPVFIDTKTGFITETSAMEIEAGATATMRAVLMAKPKASGVQFVLSRTDNILSTKTLTGDARVIPLGYVEYINITVGYLNPALRTEAA